MNNYSTIGGRKEVSSAKRFILLALFVGGISLAWYYRALWVPKEMPTFFATSSPSAELMKSGGQVCVYGVDGASVAGVKAGTDGCVKGINVSPGKPITVAAGGKQATLTFKEWGQTLPLPGFEPQQASATPPPGTQATTATSGPTPWPAPNSAATEAASGGAPAAGGSSWTTITESLGKVLGGSKVEAPSWATAKCPAGQKTIWISESGVVTSDVEGYTRVFEWQKSAAIAVKGGDGKFHVGKRIAPGVWCTQ